MEHRNLGRSGLRVSAIGLGCNNFGGRLGREETQAVLHAALDAGITLLDTADAYGDRGGSETLIGELLGPRRQDVVLATKFALPMDGAEMLKGASRRYIVRAVEASLRRLRTDWIDLLQQHRPDPLTPIEETLRALDDLVRAGKVRYVGCSNLPAWQVVDACWTARHCNLNGFVSCQDEYSLLARDIEQSMIPAMQCFGLGLLPYFPLASGLLTGKYSRGKSQSDEARLRGNPRLAERFLTDANLQRAERLTAWAGQHGHSLLDLAFAWLLARPPVASVIAGAMTPEQVRQNVAAGGWSLGAAEMAEIDAVLAA